MDARSVLTTMKAIYKNEIFKWHPNECKAIENRCTIIYMGTRLKEIFTEEEIKHIHKMNKELLLLLYESMNIKENVNINFNKYINFT